MQNTERGGTDFTWGAEVDGTRQSMLVFRGTGASPAADWAAWHLPGGPVGPTSRWAAT